MVEADLAAGTLVRLAMPDHPGGIYRFAAVWRRDHPPGPAGSWLLQQFVERGAGDGNAEGVPDI
jgi:DNA-binding transcriptional LysR family regulator